jgi:putative ABC transport system ATP-binding protein
LSSPPDPAEIVRWDGVAKVFPGPDQVIGLHPTNLVLRRFDFVSITGPSGAGKSTMLNLLGLIDTPSSGQVRMGGEPLHDLRESHLSRVRSRDIAFVFQAFHLMESRSVLENVALALTYRGVPRAAREDAARRAIDQVGLGHRRDMPTSVLSGGERQRVALARAFTAAPRLLLCDEPTGNLDPENGRQILDLLDEVNATGTCVVVVTHDEEAARRAHLRWRIDGGRVARVPEGAR